jgi:hypothetical protein
VPRLNASIRFSVSTKLLPGYDNRPQMLLRGFRRTARL